MTVSRQLCFKSIKFQNVTQDINAHFSMEWICSSSSRTFIRPIKTQSCY